MHHNALLRIAQSSCLILTTYLRLLHSWIYELVRTCKRLKPPSVIRNIATDRNRPIFRFDDPGRADLHLLVLKPANLFDENCDGVQYFGNCCD